MIIVMGEVRFGDGEMARLQGALARNVEASRREDGCERYTYAADLLDPNVLRICEAWRDQAALDAHSRKIPELMAPLADAKIEAIAIKAWSAEFLQNVMGE
jgi:quinol monooxygenase YgiN